MPIVYMATNTRNGKRYIGASTETLAKRRNRHEWEATKGPSFCRVFHAAIRKYGTVSFEWSVLLTCHTRDELMREEVRLIAEMKPEYNITSGGTGIIGVPRTKIWLERMSKSQKGRKRSPEDRAKMKAAARPELRWKSVTCLNDGMFFRSFQDAAAWYGIKPSDVSRVTRGDQHVTGAGLSFAISAVPMDDAERTARLTEIELRRLDGLRRQGNRTNHRPKRERLKKTAEQISAGKSARAGALRRGVEKNSKLVKCIETGVLYKSISEAARSHGVCVAAMSSAIHRNGRSRGLSFRFAER
jgi:group I intron endonuclease